MNVIKTVYREMFFSSKCNNYFVFIICYKVFVMYKCLYLFFNKDGWKRIFLV